VYLSLSLFLTHKSLSVLSFPCDSETREKRINAVFRERYGRRETAGAAVDDGEKKKVVFSDFVLSSLRRWKSMYQ